MKRLVFISGLFSIFLLSSCKKDYLCECSYEIFGQESTVDFPLEEALSKKEAEEACTLSIPGVEDNDIDCHLVIAK